MLALVIAAGEVAPFTASTLSEVQRAVHAFVVNRLPATLFPPFYLAMFVIDSQLCLATASDSCFAFTKMNTAAVSTVQASRLNSCLLLCLIPVAV